MITVILKTACLCFTLSFFSHCIPPTAKDKEKLRQLKERGVGDLDQTVYALKLYYADNGKYPLELKQLTPRYIQSFPNYEQDTSPNNYERLIFNYKLDDNGDYWLNFEPASKAIKGGCNFSSSNSAWNCYGDLK